MEILDQSSCSDRSWDGRYLTGLRSNPAAIRADRRFRPEDAGTTFLPLLSAPSFISRSDSGSTLGSLAFRSLEFDHVDPTGNPAAHRARHPHPQGRRTGGLPDLL